MGIWRFVAHNWEKQFQKIYFIVSFHHFQIQAMKYTFSSNDWNCEKAPFSSLVKKIWMVKIPEFLAEYHT